MYIDKPLYEYLDDLSAKKPAPGGGSAAALSASIGASLICMVANYTVGNPKYEGAQGQIADILVKAGNSGEELKGLIDKDVEAYNILSKTMKESGKDEAKLDAAYKGAANVPFEICKVASEMLKICKELALVGNKNLVTDTAIAAILLEGAFFSAKYNVYINLKYIRDIKYIGSVHNVLAPLEESMPKLKEEILEMCEDAIK